MASPRVVFLDLGNVLAFHDNALLFRELGKRAGLAGEEVEKRLMTPEWEQANRGTLGANDLRRFVSAAVGYEFNEQEFYKVWNCHFTVHEEVLPLIDALRSKARVGVISNTNAVHVQYLRTVLPVLDVLSPLLLSCEVGLVKPERELFEKACRRAGCSPSEAVFFDDIQEYVDAARIAGLSSRLFTTARQFAADLASMGLSVTPSA